MYCSKCGEKRIGNSLFCSNCGSKFDNAEEMRIDKSSRENHTAGIVLGIVSIVGSLFVIFTPLTLIVAIIGLVISLVNNKKKSNTAGIVLNSVGLGLSLIIMIFFLALIVSVSDEEDDDDVDRFDNDYYEMYPGYGHKF